MEILFSDLISCNQFWSFSHPVAKMGWDGFVGEKKNEKEQCGALCSTFLKQKRTIFFQSNNTQDQNKMNFRVILDFLPYFSLLKLHDSAFFSSGLSVFNWWRRCPSQNLSTRSRKIAQFAHDMCFLYRHANNASRERHFASATVLIN